MAKDGFVTAVRGAMQLSWRDGRANRTVRPAWFVVSRSGADGALLLIGWVGRGVGPMPPPRLTLAARPLGRSAHGTPFMLLDTLPPGIAVAGRLVPARGAVTLTGDVDRLFLRLVAQLQGRLDCRIEAERQRWFGEVL
ncbi:MULTISPECIES: hypothetical protein [Roseomonadaceae]|uniref:SCP2 domain-containing protein n=1 Tax=Falsiroseomonas oleicola TaxID=2801474 RepID=A0ABS6HAF1_9PROT|nr:hypothetical protein [Roseomonas oleicola]MBU8545692.1 hypothetical protein [Roseomonas oleicola]